MKIKYFLKSMKWRFYVTTLQIFIGYFLAVGENLDIWMIPTLFMIFGPLLHGGIYTLNDIFDLKEDKKHKTKKHRPLASGKISLAEAYIFSLTLIIAALAWSAFINRALVILCLVFLTVNITYSLLLKKIPYIEIIVNSLTHPLRFYTGVIAGGAFAFHEIALFFALFALTVAILKRKKEIMENQVKARKALSFYTNNGLRNLLLIVGICLFVLLYFSKGLAHIFGFGFVVLYLILIIGYHNNNYIKKLMDKWY